MFAFFAKRPGQNPALCTSEGYQHLDVIGIKPSAYPIQGSYHHSLFVIAEIDDLTDAQIRGVIVPLMTFGSTTTNGLGIDIPEITIHAKRARFLLESAVPELLKPSLNDIYSMTVMRGKRSFDSITGVKLC